MKLNWGAGIAIFYVTFATVMVMVVVASTKYDPGLVQKDYYALDLNYQHRLNGKQNTAKLATRPYAEMRAQENSVYLHLPPDMEPASGNIRCYRGASTRDDFRVSMEPGQKPVIPTAGLAPGRWHAEVEWTAGQQYYFWETVFEVSP
jgi:nitrogen fixation protein FixH